MRTPSIHKVALSHVAKDLPKNVERYVQEGLDKGMDEGKAWAIAWSRYCKYKEPGSPHCQMETSEYLPNQGKKTASDEHIVRGYIRLIMDKAAAVAGYKVTKKGPISFMAVNTQKGVKVVADSRRKTLSMFSLESGALIKSMELTGIPLKDSYFFVWAE